MHPSTLPGAPADTRTIASLRTADGVRLSVRCWHAMQPNGTSVVLVHGFTGSKNHGTVVATARALAADGYDVVTYDGRGHGTSEGTCTLGELERLDVAAAVERARRDSDSVVAVGASMGAIAALRHAASARDLAGVVSVSAPARWTLPRTPHGVASALLTRTRPGRSLVRRRLGVRLSGEWSWLEPPVELVRRVTAPVAVVHGLRDRFIGPAAAKELHAAAPDPRRLDLVARMGHAFGGDEAVGAVLRAVRWTLTAQP